MRKILGPASFLFCLIAVPAAYSQGIQINRQNRTISVRATETVKVAPQIAVVRIAYDNYAATKSAAYDENVRVSAKIIQALLKAGLNKEQIHTYRISLLRTQRRNQTPSRKNGPMRKFRALQSWSVRVPVAQAQTVVDRAVAAGANIVLSVNWTVKDRDALTAKADAAALDEAQRIARQITAKFGDKLGELLYASNSNPPQVQPAYGFGQGSGGGTYQAVAQAVAGGVAGGVPPARPPLRLFPGKVRETATVYAVFALE